MEPESILWEAILDLQRGERERAGALLVRYTRTYPESAEGWLWLSHCLDDPKEIEFCLRKARRLDPAQAASFTGQPAAAVQTGVQPPSVEPTSSLPPAPAAPSAQRKVAQRARATSRPAVWIGLAVLALICAAGGWFYLRNRQAKLSRLPSLVQEAQPLIENCAENCDYASGVDILDQVLKVDSGRADARYLRALALLRLAETSLEKKSALSDLRRAVEDIDRCIEVTRPPRARDYVLRYQVYHALALRQDTRADAELYLKAALENLSAAARLGGSQGAERDLLLVYFQMGQCEEGMRAYDFQSGIWSTGQPDAVLEEWQAVGLLTCHGSLEDALNRLEDSVYDHPEALRAEDQRGFAITLTLYYQGRAEDALAELDRLIADAPQGGGERYYLRALILYEQGAVDLALEDLAAGEKNTWLRGGLDAYLRSRIALDEGDREQALRLLQQAEASAPHGIYSPMAKRYRSEIEDLGGAPLEQKSRVRIRTTPIALDR